MAGQSGNRHEGRKSVDLTLKLGLPYPDTSTNQSYDVPSDHFSNLNFNGPYTAPQESPSYGRMVNGGDGATKMVNNAGTPNAMNYGMVNDMGNNQNPIMNIMNRSPAGAYWPSQHTGYHNNNYMNYYGSGILMNQFNNNNNNNGSAMGSIPVMAHNPYANFSYGDSTRATSASSSMGRRQRSGGISNNYVPDEQIKRCTNVCCNTAETPMWRKGPLGPKTLCNACGIKYRKEEERKRSQQAEISNSNA